jgi:hypothetical protein
VIEYVAGSRGFYQKNHRKKDGRVPERVEKKDRPYENFKF